jgi:hypothetical protein
MGVSMILQGGTSGAQLNRAEGSSMSTETGMGIPAQGGSPPAREQSSLSTAGARNLSGTTKSAPRMQEISSRRLLRMLPWVQVTGGRFRVNRRLGHAVGGGRVAFGRACNRRGIHPGSPEVHGRRVPVRRGVPILSCDRIPISRAGSSSILAMRVGEDDQGVIGLHPTGIPDECEPGLSVRLAGIDETAVISYPVTAHDPAAILVPDAVGVLENVDVARRD